MKDILSLIRDVPDFPKEGIIFKDITPLLGDAEGLRIAADMLAEPFRDSDVDYVAGIEARGWIFASMLAERFGAGMIPIRKPGKLPCATVSRSFDLEYGSDSIEVHVDATKGGGNVLMVDDLLATGGTMKAACDLIEEIEGRIVGCAFVIELSFLNGRDKLSEYLIHSLLKVDGE
jgi:adenine phosphoribosyltransferase